MAQTALVVLTTLANDADARALVTALVAARLVACGTLLPGARSIYRWEGQVTEEAEVVVLLKTDASRWEALCAAVRIEEAESLTETSSIASPADVARAGLPPPITAQLPAPVPPPASAEVPAPDGPRPEPTLDDALA